MKMLTKLDFIKENGAINKENGVLKFSVIKTGNEEENAKFCAYLNGEISDEVVLEYSLLGFYRGLANKAPFIYLTDGDGNIVPLISNDDLSTDGRKYTVSASVPKGEYTSITLLLSVDRAKQCELSVYSFYTCSKAEIAPMLSGYEEKEKAGIIPIDISSLYNGNFNPEAYEVKICGGSSFRSESISPCGIPFKVKREGDNAVIPSSAPKENEDIIENFGVSARRKVCRPISRDSKTEIKIDKKISEVYFILAMTGERYQRYTFATKGNILGSYGKEVGEPLRVLDVEGFFAEVVYRDGTRDKALPKNLSEDRFGLSGDVGVYAVGCDFKEVESVILHNKKQDTDFSLLALSVNENDVGYYPELSIPANEKKKNRKASSEKCITLSDNTLTVRNGALLARLDLAETLSLTSLTSDYASGFSASSASLLKFRSEGEKELIAPKITDVATEATKAEITLQSGEFTFLVEININEENNLVTSLKVNNNSQNNEKISIFFPLIENINAKNEKDLYYFVPKYQNLNSNESVVVCEESSPSFPMQFMSVYSREEGAGIGILTRERDTAVRIYHLEKRAGVASLSVEYPDMYVNIGAGESFSSSETVLETQNGDWHTAFESYRKWLSTWYVPYKCQNKKWYRECFWLLSEITDFFETYEMVKFPIWHEKGENPRFRFLDILEEQKSLSGTYPDILHMWHWTVRYDENGKKRCKWGNYGDEDYDLYGGLERFRGALDEFQKKTGVYSSMYMHPTLFAETYPDFKKYEHLKVINESGKNIQLADSFRMCHANKDWRDYALSKYPRVYSELGVPILYVDEFSLRIENRCYAEGHGHEVPSNLLKTDREFISRLKDTVPEELVLYGEYAAVDVNARYIDCNITYGILDSISEMIERSWRGDDSSDNLGRVMTDAYRFAFPKIVQLVLPMALRNLSWQPHKFIFWNGEAEYDSLWDLLESEGNDFTRKAYSIKKKYADAFSSDTPEMLIETLSPAICINKFPGKERTVYTVYNRAYRTYRGEVLSIPHVNGNVYYDVWNDCPLDVKIEDGCATLSLRVDAQSIGCILVSNQTAK